YPGLPGASGRPDPGQARVDSLVDGLADPADEAVDERLLVVRTEFLTRRQHRRNVIPRSIAWCHVIDSVGVPCAGREPGCIRRRRHVSPLAKGCGRRRRCLSGALARVVYSASSAARRSMNGTWPALISRRAVARPNHPARATSGNLAVLPERGGHSSSKVLLRILSGSSSPRPAHAATTLPPR